MFRFAPNRPDACRRHRGVLAIVALVACRNNAALRTDASPHRDADPPPAA